MLKGDHLIISIVYGIVCMIGFVFFIVWQSYAQRTEILLSTFALTLIVIEILLSVLTIVRNTRAMPVLTNERKLERMKQAQERFKSAIKTE